MFFRSAANSSIITSRTEMNIASNTESGSLPLCPELLQRLLGKNNKNAQNPVLVCVGTDRIIGDSLGPLVGSMLLQTCGNDPSCGLNIYGTLQNTVHALNLADTASYIKEKHADSIVIAIDASLGSREDIGSVFIRSGTLRPGAGVHKNLPQLGDITITGIAGEQSRHPYLTLQTARLSLIMQMAETICGCIRDVYIE